MERLNLKFKVAQEALSTLKSIQEEPFTTIVRDASIQRFEYTFEAAWKCVKEFLKEVHGVSQNSPKQIFRELNALGLLTLDETSQCLGMTDVRNETSHTYNKKIADEIYKNIPKFTNLLEIILNLISKNLSTH